MSLSFSVCLSPLLQPAEALNSTQELFPSQLMVPRRLMKNGALHLTIPTCFSQVLCPQSPLLSTLPGALPCSVISHCDYHLIHPPPALYQQKFHSNIKVNLKCSLFHEDFSEPTTHRKSLLPPNSGVILPISLLRPFPHSDSQLGYACMCLFIPPTGQGSPQEL